MPDCRAFIRAGHSASTSVLGSAVGKSDIKTVEGTSVGVPSGVTVRVGVLGTIVEGVLPGKVGIFVVGTTGNRVVVIVPVECPFIGMDVLEGDIRGSCGTYIV